MKVLIALLYRDQNLQIINEIQLTEMKNKKINIFNDKIQKFRLQCVTIVYL